MQIAVVGLLAIIALAVIGRLGRQVVLLVIAGLIVGGVYAAALALFGLMVSAAAGG